MNELLVLGERHKYLICLGPMYVHFKQRVCY